MMELGCPHCKYQTLGSEGGDLLCPHGCTLGDFQTDYRTDYAPSHESVDLSELFGENRAGLYLISTDSEQWTKAMAERSDTTRQAL